MTPASDRLPLACEVEARSVRAWGESLPTTIIGRHPVLSETLERVARLARADGPILITGESGTGKELLARACYLLAANRTGPLVTVNCAQYTNDHIVASELFGHEKGSFTGAVRDSQGVFMAAQGGTVFLDEVGELPAAVQAMLLRLIGEGEVTRVGGTRPVRVHVRIVAATNRDLPSLVAEGRFRADLYYRLRHLSVATPPLRKRGRDWELIAGHHLNHLAGRFETVKALSPDTVEWLRSYPWPGNVRELRSCLDTGFHLCDGPQITLEDFGDALEMVTRDEQLRKIHFTLDQPSEILARLIDGEDSFWDIVHRPFMARDLNRAQVRQIIEEGLTVARGSYKRLVQILGLPPSDYLKFMDFLRHHRLKPSRRQWRSVTDADQASPPSTK